MIKNCSITGTNNNGGGHEASGERREQVATRRLYKEQRAMSKKERLAIKSVTNWKIFGRRLMKREEEVDQEDDFLKSPQYTLSSRTRTVSSNFVICYLFEYLTDPSIAILIDSLVRLIPPTHTEQTKQTHKSLLPFQALRTRCCWFLSRSTFSDNDIVGSNESSSGLSGGSAYICCVDVNAVVSSYLSFTFRSSYVALVMSFTLAYFSLVIIFAAIYSGIAAMHPECIISGGYMIGTGEGRIFGDCFHLSWSTFATVVSRCFYSSYVIATPLQPPPPSPLLKQKRAMELYILLQEVVTFMFPVVASWWECLDPSRHTWEFCLLEPVALFSSEKYYVRRPSPRCFLVTRLWYVLGKESYQTANGVIAYRAPVTLISTVVFGGGMITVTTS